MKEHKVPHTGIAFQPKLEHRRTELQPFSFEERDKRMMSEKEKKIHQMLEEEKKVSREFAFSKNKTRNLVFMFLCESWRKRWTSILV